MHTRKRTLITEDVKQFFPSVRSQIVFDIWHQFFRFRLRSYATHEA